MDVLKEFLQYSGRDIPYFYNDSKQEVVSVKSVQDSIAKTVEQNLYKCVSIEDFKTRGFIINTGVVKASVTLNNKISNFYGSQLIKIKKMWFVITKKAGLIKKHSHLDSDLSVVLYLRFIYL